MTEHPDRLLSSVVSAMQDCVAEVERLRAALGFYASPSNWSVDGTICAPSPHSRYRPDCGDTARAALAPKEPSE